MLAPAELARPLRVVRHVRVVERGDGRALAEVEKRKIELALKEVSGDKAKAADMLGLPFGRSPSR